MDGTFTFALSLKLPCLFGRGNFIRAFTQQSQRHMLSKMQNDFHMVARTATAGSSGRSSTEYSVLGGKLPKWKPRAGLSGHPTWVDAIEDTAAQVGLMPILRSICGAPTIRERSVSVMREDH